MFRLYIFIFSLFVVFNAHGQLDKERFEKIFEEEIDGDEKYNTRQNHSARYSHTIAQDLPHWIFNPPVSSNGSVVALGISDPGLDSAQAYDMAIYRAQIMANILRKSTTQLLCDFFLNDEASSQQIVYEHFSRIITQMPDSVNSYTVLESYTNSFDETMVLISYTPPEYNADLKLSKVFLELYKNETDHSIYGGYESIYELLVKQNGGNSMVPMFYQLTEYGPRNDVVGATYNKEYELPIYSLSYNCNLCDSVSKVHLSHGLWKDYFKSLMSEILIAARHKPENIKVMGDNYQEEASRSSSYEKLTRGLSVNKMSFVFNGIRASENGLKVNLSEVPLVSPKFVNE